MVFYSDSCTLCKRLRPAISEARPSSDR